MRLPLILATTLVAGCAMLEPKPVKPDLSAQLAAETQERQRLDRALAEQEQALRAGAQREEAMQKELASLRQQLEALKSIERGILEREERLRKKQK